MAKVIDKKEERGLYSLVEISRYPDNILLIHKGIINQSSQVIGQITYKDEFEKNLWLEAIKKINEILASLNKS